MTTLMNKLVDKFIETDELGHYDAENHSVTLYGIPNDRKTIERVKGDIAKITNKCRIIILDPKDKHTNISILDIGL